MDRGIVTEWHDDEGWGVIESPATPGGCWAHYSAVRMSGYRSVDAGSEVHFTHEQADQDGYAFRAVAVWPPGVEPGSPDPVEVDTAPTAAYRSKLTISFDTPL